MKRWLAIASVALCACPRPEPIALEPGDAGPLLEAWAVLPADTFAPGPASGARLDASETHGRAVPFPGQPVQGFSSLLAEDGGYLALADNGYGAPDNSDDFLLRAYHLVPDFTHHTMRAKVAFTLSDPERVLPFTLARELLGDRLLTGADLDPESIQRDADGTYWVGDELGPFILHVDPSGRVLEAPYEVRLPEDTGRECPELHSPAYPMNEEASALKLAQAMRLHAESHHGLAPVVSPNHLLLRDGRTDTGLDSRARPPPELEAASSEIFDVAQLRKAGFQVLPWTVNDPARMRELIALGVTGIITDRPDLLRAEVNAADAGIDVQGHRGARGLRPENTLPAFEVALDVGADTLESDVQLTQDGVPMLWHDPVLPAARCRAPGRPAKTAPVIRDTPLSQLQQFVCDKLSADFPAQVNAPERSPVAVAFAAKQHLKSPYTPITVDELFDFVAAYEAYYASGPGAAHPDARSRARSAHHARFDLETKVNRRREAAAYSPDPVRLTRALLSKVVGHGLIERMTLESFDFGTLLLAQREVPRIRTVMLFTDSAAVPGMPGDGSNLQPEDEGRSPFLAGMLWPYRRTWGACEPRAKASGGFEAMGQMPSGRLLAVFEKPVAGEGVLGVVFDTASRTFSSERYHFEVPPQVTSVPDLQMTSETSGLLILRDDSQGRLDGYKWVARFELPPGGGEVRPEPIVNLLALRAPWLKPVPADVGVGDPFAFPFFTIESLLVLAPGRLVIANDNNYPFSVGRHVSANQPDDNELIEVRY